MKGVSDPTQSIPGAVKKGIGGTSNTTRAYVVQTSQHQTRIQCRWSVPDDAPGDTRP